MSIKKKLNEALKQISPDIEKFILVSSPGLSDFSFLEKFSKLKTVALSWNNKSDKLWDFTKTPLIEELHLCGFNRLFDISQLQNAGKLRCLTLHSDGGNGALCSINPLHKLSQLEFLRLETKIADMDIRPVISLPSLKYFDCNIDIFDTESYAMFEARRPEVEVNFFEGMRKWSNDRDSSTWFVGKNQKSHDYYGENEKIIRYSEIYNSMKKNTYPKITSRFSNHHRATARLKDGGRYWPMVLIFTQRMR